MTSYFDSIANKGMLSSVPVVEPFAAHHVRIRCADGARIESWYHEIPSDEFLRELFGADCRIERSHGS